MVSRIIATGACVPDACLTNEDLSRWMDTSDEWIRSRTGICSRHLAALPQPDENGRMHTVYEDKPLFHLSKTAAERAVSMAAERYGLTREDIDLVIVATSSPDEVCPALACRLQAALELPRAAAFDLVLACTGFLASLQAADAYIRAGVYRTILIVGAEVLSRFLDWNSRDTAILFGDGAGAAIVSGDPRFIGENASEGGVLRTVLHSDGSGGDALCGRAMYCNEQTPVSLTMDGRAVFSFAVRRVPEVIREVLAADPAADKAGDAEGVAESAEEKPDLYILHQANFRIIESIAKKLHEPLEKFPHNLERLGNTSAASIPLLLDELNREGRLKEGQLLCLAGFGGGLSYGAALLRW